MAEQMPVQLVLGLGPMGTLRTCKGPIAVLGNIVSFQFCQSSKTHGALGAFLTKHITGMNFLSMYGQVVSGGTILQAEFA